VTLTHPGEQPDGLAVAAGGFGVVSDVVVGVAEAVSAPAHTRWCPARKLLHGDAMRQPGPWRKGYGP
jgi:hypothetical protein